MTTYHSFDRAFDLDKDFKTWSEEFSLMTRSEFFEFFDYATGDRLSKCIQERTPESYETVRRRLSLFAALCHKMMVCGHFCEDLTEEQRAATIKTAEAYATLFINAFSQVPAGKIFENGWTTTVDYCSKFGYSAEAIYRALSPHRIFADF